MSSCPDTAQSCDDGNCKVFAHKLIAWRQRGVPVAPSATPTRQSNRRFIPPATPNNSYERGVPRDSRGMPYLDAAGSVIGQREFNQKRHQIEDGLRANHREAALSTTTSGA